MIRRLAAVMLMAAGILYFSSIAGADFDLKKWPLWREIQIDPQIEQPAYVRIELDGPVFAGARTDLADLRVIDQSGGEVPSVLSIPAESRIQETRSYEMLDRSLTPDGRLSFTIDLGTGAVRHNSIHLSTSSVNFSRRVQIETSSDNKNWAVARSDGYIFSFQRDSAVSYLTVDYPVSTRRYMRITIFNRAEMKEEPIEITGAEVTINAEPEPELIERKVASQSRREDAKARTSIITLDLGLPGIPSSVIELTPDQANFHRHVEITGKQQIEDDSKLEPLTWSNIGSGEIYQVSISGHQSRNSVIKYHETRLRYLRITIFNYDDRPIPLGPVRVLSRPHRLVFKAEPRAGYRLFYGNAAASRPKYDLERMIGYVDLKQTRMAAIGPQQGKAAKSSSEVEESRPGQPAWLIGTLIASALVLVWLIFRLAKKTVG